MPKNPTWPICPLLSVHLWVVTHVSLCSLGTRDCDLEVKGGDAVTDLLRGGVDGLYKRMGCFEGKPMYSRVGGPSEGELSFYAGSAFFVGSWLLVG
jgi:hypothetical protein